MSIMLDEIEKIFSAGGILSRVLPNHEQRVGQEQMAMAVGLALDGFPDGQPAPDRTGDLASMLAAEAETGIGKTLAYLVPAALCGQKVVISTGTLNLQEQILKKEIPFIRKHIQPQLKAVCVKGRQNYACLYRLKLLFAGPQMQLFNSSQEQNLLYDWLQETESGDRAELPWLPDNSPLWEQVASSSGKCLGSRCPGSASCFISRLRRKAGQAQVIIVNHHLFFSDLNIRRFGHAEVLPRYQSVIFDEAHHLEDVATRYFGVTFSVYQLLDLVKDIETMAQEHLAKKPRQKTMQIARSLATRANSFSKIFPKQKGRYHLPAIIEQTKEWQSELEGLNMALDSLIQQLETVALTQEELWDAAIRRSHELLENLSIITLEQDSSAVYWCERRQKTVSLTASPIEVSPFLQEHLYSQVNTIIFTSATLTTSGNFNYMFKRFGLDQETESLRLASPFDYAGRTRLYIPAQGFPEPNSKDYPRAVRDKTLELLNASQGRALLLFTSFLAMHRMQEALDNTLPFPILVQGEAPKNVLLETFQQQTDSVLLAVASFWEGVNVPGDTLSCVIIDKLPFEVPSDPVIMARINLIKEEGGNPFFDFQVPRAILSLRQGLGRLLRSATDHGLLAIMDIRLYSKGYGRSFLKSIPPSPIIRRMAEVKNFFAE